MQARRKTQKHIHSALNAVLEFGPTIGFVLVYLVVRNDVFTVGGRSYSGLVAVTAMFMPVFAAAIGLLWALTGRIVPVLIATAAMLFIFGELSIWLNDPRLVKIKPTVIYFGLGLFVLVGLLRGKLWLKYIIQEILPMEEQGWRILTKRVMVLFFASAAANELV